MRQSRIERDVAARPPGSALGLALVAWCAALAGPATVRAQAPKAAESGDLALANRLLTERLYAPATEEYERVLKKARPASPEAAEALFGLASAQLFLNRLAEARRHFEDFLRTAPEHPGAPTAWFRIGETAYLLGDLPAARKALEAYTARYPNHRHLDTAWPYLGDVCLRAGDLPAARQAYEKALEAHPNGRLADRARCGLARAVAAEGDPARALSLLTPLADARTREFSDQARYQIGQIHAAAGRHAEAVDAFETLERDAPRSTLAPEARLARATALARLDRRDEAEAVLAKLVAESPRNLGAQAAYELGTSQLERGRPADALATFDDAIRRFDGAPLVPPLRFRAAEAIARLGRADEARAAFLRVVESYPGDPWADDALLQAAALAAKSGDAPAADALVARLEAEYPRSALLPNGRLIAGRAAFEADRIDDAIRGLEALTAGLPADAEIAADARYLLALAYRKAGRAEEAAGMLDALARSPNSPAARNARFLLGQGHVEAGRYAQAIAPLEGYLEARPDGEVADAALAHLAHAHVALDRPEPAAEALRTLEARFPRSKELARTRLRLGEDALKREQFARAAALLRQVAEGDDPSWRPRALSGLGWALFREGRLDEAAEALETLLSVAPDDPLAPEAAFVRARALQASGKIDAALAAYALAIDRYGRDPAAPAASLARARLLAASGKPADAAEAFAAHVKASVKSDDAGADLVFAEWATALLDSGRPDEADAVFRRLLDTFPASPRAADARLNLAVSAYDAKRLDEALTLLDPLVVVDVRGEPEVTQKALFLRGRILADRKDWPAAAGAFDRLLETYPDAANRPLARFWRAEIAFRSGDPKAAEPLFARLLDDETAPAETAWTARLRRVQCLVQLRRPDEALAVAEALRIDLPESSPLRPELEYQRGRALAGVAPPRFEEARAAYDLALAAEPGDDLSARSTFMKGETYFYQEDFPAARREFLRAATFYNAPRWQAAGLLETGKVYERLTRWPEAAEIYDRLLAKFSGVAEAVESLAEAERRLPEARRRAGPGAISRSGDEAADPARRASDPGPSPSPVPAPVPPPGFPDPSPEPAAPQVLPPPAPVPAGLPVIPGLPDLPDHGRAD